MKKLSLIFIALSLLLSFVLLSKTIQVQALPSTYPVTFQSMFDDANPGTADALGSYAYGTTLSLETAVNGASSPSANYIFAFFIKNGVVRYDLPVDHLFVITGPLDIIAVYSQEEEHAVLFMDSNAKLIGVDYVMHNGNADDSTLTLPDKPGYVVSSSAKWHQSMNNIIDDTVLILQYDKSTSATFTLTVTEGTGAGTYTFNDVVTVTPHTTGTPFSHWEDESGAIISTQSTYSFTMLENHTLIAQFSGTPLADEPRILMSEDLEIRAGYRTYLSQFYLPEGHELLEYGLLTLAEDLPIDDIETPQVNLYKGFKYFAITDEFVMSIATDLHYSVRAYIVTEDSEGITHYDYSERNEQYIHQGPIDLRSAYNFTILSKTAVTTTGLTDIVGDVGISPAASTYMTGFGLIMDISQTFSTSSLVSGKIYGPNYVAPTPAMLTTAVSDMETAYTDGAGRAPNYTNLYSGDISGQTLAPGVYKWTTSLSISDHVILNGSSTDTWIFIVTGNIAQAADVSIILSGGAVAENVVWVVAGLVDIGARAHFEGTILCMTSVHLQTGATLKGRILSQTATTLDGNDIN